MTDPRMRGTTTRELIAALESEGFRWVGGHGGHRVYRHPDGRKVVVPYHGSGQPLPKGLLGSLLRGTAWTEDDLTRLGLLGHRAQSRQRRARRRGDNPGMSATL